MLWLVETHADDVYLSLGWHIENLWRGRELGIITVFASEHRCKESSDYAQAVGCDYRCLAGVESGSMKGLPGSLPSLKLLPSREENQFAFPLGLDHPEHRLVSSLAKPGDLRYVDMPCCSKLKVASELLSVARNMRVYSIAAVGNRKWRHLPIYKSQSKFFYFNPPKTLPRLEIVLR